jgi:hypothetical protein
LGNTDIVPRNILDINISNEAEDWTHQDILTELENRRKDITNNPAHP